MPSAAAIALRHRFDLRTGRLVGARIEGPYLSTLTEAQATLKAAASAWEALDTPGALSLCLSERLSMPALAAGLDACARAAGFLPGALTFEMEERALLARSGPLAEDLRAHGWAIALRADPACPLPFGARARSLYAEVVVLAGRPPSPFAGLDPRDADSFSRRILAAREADLTLTAEGVHSEDAAKQWLLAGFDRAEGAFQPMPAFARVQGVIALAAREPVALSFSSR